MYGMIIVDLSKMERHQHPYKEAFIMCKRIEFGRKLMVGVSLLAHKGRKVIACEEFDVGGLRPTERLWFENGVKVQQEKGDTIFEVTIEDKSGKLEPKHESENNTIFFASRNAINVIVRNNKTGHSHSIRVWRQNEGNKKIIKYQRTYCSYQDTSSNQHLDLSEFRVVKPENKDNTNQKPKRHPAGRKPGKKTRPKHIINVRGMNSQQAIESLV